MALQVTSQPVELPTGIRATVGVLDWNGATYSVGGDTVTIAQWGGGSNGIPARQPDFVLFTAGSAADDDDTDAAVLVRYVSGKVANYGPEPLVDEAGLGENDAAACSTKVKFLAIWVGFPSAGATTA